MRRAIGSPPSRTDKERKQKKLLLMLVPVLALLLLWQGPKTVGALTGGAEKEAQAGGSSPAPSAPASPPAVAPPAGTPPAGSASPDEPASADQRLPDTGSRPAADPGQLLVFSRFVGKNPFVQQVSEPDPDDEEPPAASGEAGAEAETAGSSDGDADRGESGNVAVVEVNGERETVPVGRAFAGEIFRLASVDDAGATVGLVAGLFSTGKKTIELAVGERIVLVNEADGARYAVRLLRVGPDR